MSDYDDFEEFWESTMSISRDSTLAPPTNGRWTAHTPDIIYSGIPCHITPLTGTKGEVDSKISMTCSHQIITPNALVMKNGDVVTDQDGEKYEVFYFEQVKGMIGHTSLYVSQLRI